MPARLAPAISPASAARRGARAADISLFRTFAHGTHIAPGEAADPRLPERVACLETAGEPKILEVGITGGCDRGGLGHWGVTRPAMAMLANWCRPDVISSDLHTLSIGTPASKLLVTMASLLASGCRCPQWCGLQRSMPPAPCGLRIVAPCGQEHRPTRIGRGGGRRVPARGCGRRAILGAAASGVAWGSARRDVAGITVYPAFAIRYSRRTISISSATDVSAASSS